ncbi:MAG: AEC family transporter [Deltaproteobacteria bacterium]|nr:AEC family transporter [Deltaproteobacteria bacterium]
MVFSSLFPVFALLLLGNLAKRFGLTDDDFLKTSDRLIYFIFFPVLLFWKIGGADTGGGVAWNLCLAGLAAIAAVYLVSATALKIFRVSHFKAGTFSQSCYRFNTYIGMAVVYNALGDEGVKHFGIMVGFVIPFINVLAVSTLIWHSGERMALESRIRITLREIVTNPLIIGCLAGLLYARTINTFPTFLDNALRLSTAVALPLALLSIGGALTLKSMRGNALLSVVAAVIKLLILPGIGYGMLRWFGVSGIPFKVGMIYFTLPASASIYVLSAQLKSDTELASAAVVLSTVLSFFSLTMGLLL